MKIKAIDSAHAVATGDAILLCLWRTVTTRQAIAELGPIAHELVSQSPGGISMLTVVEANADMPDAQVRGDLAELFRQLSKNVICSGLVFEGSGFRAATVRGITTGINLVAKQPFPHKVFGSVREASTWMAAHAAMNMSAVGIIERVDEVRSALDLRAERRA